MIGVFWKRESRPIQWHQCRLLTRKLFLCLHIYSLYGLARVELDSNANVSTVLSVSTSDTISPSTSLVPHDRTRFYRSPAFHHTYVTSHLVACAISCLFVSSPTDENKKSLENTQSTVIKFACEHTLVQRGVVRHLLLSQLFSIIRATIAATYISTYALEFCLTHFSRIW